MRHKIIPCAPLRCARKDPIGVFCGTRLSIDNQMLKKMRSGGAPHHRSKYRAYAITTRVPPKRWYAAQALRYQVGVRLRTRKARRGSSSEHAPSFDPDRHITVSPVWSRLFPVRYQGFLR